MGKERTITRKSNEMWKEELSPEQYHVTREKGTERPFSGEYYHNTESGMYTCVCCGNEIFSSVTKYDSGSGWPSFWEPVSEKSVQLEPDNSLFLPRTEVKCHQCEAHLGHVFDDGPEPTGKRYCVNSVALHFKKA